jgi:membrane associated rhomboid family serine protease
MGYRDYHRPTRRGIWSENNSLMMLIVFNALVFILLHFIKNIYALSRIPEESFQSSIFSHFILPSDSATFFGRPWTLLTAMFTEMNLFRLLSHLFWLWTFGSILQDLAGERKLFPLYLYGGLAGALSFLVFSAVMSGTGNPAQTFTYHGALASVMAVASAVTVISPQYRLFPMIGGGIPLWVLTLVFFIIGFAAVSNSPVLLFSLLSAAAVGFLFARGLMAGRDWSLWMNRLFNRVATAFNPDRSRPSKEKVREKVFYETGGREPYRRKANVTQQKVDEILDKINQKGYGRLSEEERDILRRASEEGL